MSIHQIKCTYTFFEVIIVKEYWEILKELREDRDIKQKTVAQILGTTQQVYSRYEKGINEMPIRHLKTLCLYYKVSADYVLSINESYSKSRKQLIMHLEKHR